MDEVVVASPGSTSEATGIEVHKLPRPSGIEALVLATFTLLGLAIGTRPLGDNSSFVHLRTGIEIVKTWHIPTTDPYSFTAHGQPWVVQSWLASLAYGLAYRLDGVHVVVLLNALLMAGLALAVATLARTGVGTRTMVSAGIAVILGALYWSPRPLVFGLLGLALLMLVVERDANPWWLVPIVWIWVNTHGSFPLGYAWLGLRLVGEGIDTRSLCRPRWRLTLISVAALAVAAINPLGVKLLTFPFSIGDKQSAFKHITEWASPNFQTGQGVLTLVFIALAVIVLCRGRLPWADALPVAAFLVLGLFSARNIAPFAIVLAPALSRSWGPRLQSRLTPNRDDPVRRRLDIAAGLALGLLAVAFVASSLSGSGLALRAYPTKAEAWMAATGLLDPARHRVVAQDTVGCYLILVRGTRGRVFIDDRVDMYPVGVSADYEALLGGRISSADILNRYDADVVLWQKKLSLPAVLDAHGGWRRAYEDPDWVVLVKA